MSASATSTPRLAFITSSRSDLAKLRPYIYFFVKHRFPVSLFITSMHVNAQLSFSREEIQSYFPKGVRLFWDESFPQQQPVNALTHVLGAFDIFLTQEKTDFVFIHGDRMEAFAAASAAALRQLPICQIEAGDTSGNIDESLRHAITKLAHRFLVDTPVAKQRVLQLGEDPRSVFMTGASALSLLPDDTQQRRLYVKYDLHKPYVMVLYHPITGLTPAEQYRCAAELVEQLASLELRYVVLPPNNDPGYPEILRAFNLFPKDRTTFLPSIPAEDYLTLLRHTSCLVGNSSSGAKDAPLLGVPSVLVGSRQHNRTQGLNFPYCKQVKNAQQAAKCVRDFVAHPPQMRKQSLSAGALEKLLEKIFTPSFFKPNLQKFFYDQSR